MLQIKAAESIDYQTFNFVVKDGAARIQEFVAAGRNYGGKIFVSYIKVDVTGSTITQYVYWEECKRKWYGRKKCWTNSAPRALYTSELVSIQNGLLHHGYKALQAQLDTLASNSTYATAVQGFHATVKE